MDRALASPVDCKLVDPQKLEDLHFQNFGCIL
jgi:hypothetical protein